MGEPEIFVKTSDLPLKPEIKLTQRSTGLDAARLVAMFFVAIQHGLSVCDITVPRVFLNLDPGQLGVAIFCSLSGFLCQQRGEPSVWRWLSQRMWRVFVPYWLVLPWLLAANQLVGYKPLTPTLVLSQFFGLAVWTHRGELVGVHLWFVSLILLCYGVAAVVRWSPRLLPVAWAVGLAWVSQGDFLAGHFLAFLAGASLGLWHFRHNGMALPVMALGMVGTVLLHKGGLDSALAGSISLASAFVPKIRSAGLAQFMSRISQLTYHFYIVHATVYLAVAKLTFPNPVWVLFVGTLISLFAAYGLALAEGHVRRWLAVAPSKPMARPVSAHVQ